MNRRLKQEEVNRLPEHLRIFYVAVRGLATQFPGVEPLAVAHIRSAFVLNPRTAVKWTAIMRRESAVRAGIIEERDQGDEEYMRRVSMQEIRAIQPGQIPQLTDVALNSLKLVFGGISPATPTQDSEQ